ncbi:hypothetical protein BJ944DRAFT_259188 [Cunninghamella echinulata]|nr:hypothetical protein BJ944DRAFT_259188 [Cunninghamella echinulata]
MNIAESSLNSSYKPIEYDKTIYLIPIRSINENSYVLLSDIQAIIPTASAVLSNDKLIPFEVDTNTLTEIKPKRIIIKDTDSIWQIHTVPPANTEIINKLSLLEHRLNFLIRHLVEEEEIETLDSQLDSISLSNSSRSSTNLTTYQQQQSNTGDNSSVNIEDNEHRTRNRRRTKSSRRQHELSPPPAFSLHNNETSNSSTVSPNIPSTSTIYTNESNDSNDIITPTSNHHLPNTITNNQRHNININNNSITDIHRPHPSTSNNTSSTNSNAVAIPPPPSYETSIFGNISLLVQKLRLFEEHIPNRHKSPRWLARRHEWVSNEPTNIEQVAYQLIQLEMALLWTAVTESWIQERETWLTLVAGARSERHLAGAMVNLERHTLVMDDNWQHRREDWLSELLEIIVSVSF